MAPTGGLPPDARRAVERLLSARFGAQVRIAGDEAFPYSRVWRCVLEPAGAGAPPAVVVRVLRDDPARSGVARLHNEQAALELLGSIGSTLAPRFLAADPDAGVLVSEDLGPHPSLLDLLLGGDSGAARRALLAFARTLGTLHAQTVGLAADYARRRAALGPLDEGQSADPAAGVPVAASWRRVVEAVAGLGLPAPVAVDGEVAAIARTLGSPGSFLALSSGDPSPVNCKVADVDVRFFDFESARFRHALVDATVLRYLYPTGGPAWQLTPSVAAAVEAAYRQALAPACPGVLDDGEYGRAMAAAAAAWTILRLERLARVDAGPDRDAWPLVPPGWAGPIPTRSRRRQLVSIVDSCVDSARRAGSLPALAAWCERLAGALRARWPEASEALPLYPALAQPRRQQLPQGASRAPQRVTSGPK